MSFLTSIKNRKNENKKRERRKNKEIEKPSSNSSAIWFRFFFCKWDIYVIGCIDFGPVCLYQTDVLFSLSNASMEKRFVTFSHNLCHEKSDLIKILT